MRPKSIVWFEALYLAALVVGALNMLGRWDELVAMFSGTGAWFVFGGLISLGALLMLLVSHRASRIAKWALIGLFAYGLTAMLAGLMGWVELDMTWNEWVVWIAQAVATSLLLTPSARDWMRRRNDPAADPDTLERTFE
jgi:hypothetical protein